MARNHARIFTSIWNDADFRALPSDAQRMYFVALSQPTLSYAGVVALTVGRWAKLATDSTAAKVSAAIKKLRDTRFVVVDQDTEELWIRSFGNHDGVLDQPGLITAMAKDFLAIQSPVIRRQFLDRLGADFIDSLPGRFPKAFGHGFPDGFPLGFVDDFRRHFGHGFEDGSPGGIPGGSARTRPSSPYPSPSPRPRPPAPTEPAGDVEPANGSGPPRSADDDDGQELDEATEAAVAAAGRARLARREAEKGQIPDPVRWLATDRRRTLAALAAGDRSVLDPPKPALNGRHEDPLDRQAAAQRVLAERNERRRRGEFECSKCEDDGVIESEPDVWTQCECATSKAPA